MKYIYALLLILGTSAVNAAPACLTRSEARDRWEGIHLYWYKNDDGHRCWSNRHGPPLRHLAHKEIALTPIEHDPDPLITPQPPIMELPPLPEPAPMAMAVIEPQPEPEVELDADPEGGIWPVLEEEGRDHKVVGLGMLALGTLLVFGSIITKKAIK